jgi:hypothetical protein
MPLLAHTSREAILCIKGSAAMSAGYCTLRKQILSPSSRYSAEQKSPPQIIVSPANS